MKTDSDRDRWDTGRKKHSDRFIAAAIVIAGMQGARHTAIAIYRCSDRDRWGQIQKYAAIEIAGATLCMHCFKRSVYNPSRLNVKVP